MCLGCNYDLHGLSEARCPECGRTFDIADGSTFNSVRPLTWLDRRLLAPIGPLTFGFIALPCSYMLYLSLSSEIYYMGIYVFLMVMMCGLIAAVLGARAVMRMLIVPSGIPRRSTKARLAAVGVIVLATCVMVVTQLPLRIAFLLSRPELDRVVADIRSGALSRPIPPGHRAGLFVLHPSGYDWEDQYFFRYDIFGASGGLAYTATGTPLSYNRGADGRLGWNWHWWEDD